MELGQNNETFRRQSGYDLETVWVEVLRESEDSNPVSRFVEPEPVDWENDSGIL